MSIAEARAVFNAAIRETTDPEEVAKLEMIREYFTNPEFREALEDLSFEMTKAA